MVPDVNRTLDAASKSAASESEIQSVGGFGICQSESFWADTLDGSLDDAADCSPDDAAEDPPECSPDDALDCSPDDAPDCSPDDAADGAAEDPPDCSPDDAPDCSPDDAPEPASDAPLDPDSCGPAFEGFAVDRSFRAQPVPLKWTVGTPKAFLIGAPHKGQASGPWLWRECMTSISWPQLVQT